MTDKVVPIGNSFDVTGGAILHEVEWGPGGGVLRPVVQMTAIGHFAAMANGALTFCSLEGETEIDLTDDQVGQIVRILMKASYHAQRRREHLTGFDLVRVTRAPDGAVTVEHRGEARSMRLSKLRGSKRWGFRKCTACKEPAPELWVDATEYKPYENRNFSAEVCEPCVARLANAPSGLREVSLAVP